MEAITGAGFYGPAMTAAEREMMAAARELEGLAEEIAVLRVRLVTELQKKDFDWRLLSLGVNALVRAVATQYRLSPKARRDLSDNVAAVLNSLGDQILPPDR